VARAWATRCESRLATTAPARSSIARRCSSSSTACPAPKAEAPGSASRSFARACRRTAAGFGLHFGELSLRPVVVAEIHYVHTASSLQGEPGFGLRRARLGFNFAYGRTLAARVVFHAETERPGVLDAFVAWRPTEAPRTTLDAVESWGVSSELACVLRDHATAVGQLPLAADERHFVEVAASYQRVATTDVTNGDAHVVGLAWWPTWWLAIGAAGHTFFYDVPPIDDPARDAATWCSRARA
jgi:hypothetical protein